MVAAAIDYDRAIAILQGEDAKARAALAADRRTPPEILFYLAEDADSGVRRTVAENPATPGKADALLSRDSDIPVRCALARKIVGEGLGEAARRDMWRMGFTILETLMRDKVVRVRRILSDAFRTDPHAPRGTVLGLARDRAESVASPILRGSPVLTDADIVSIIEDGAPDWAQDAIAGRDTVSPSVSGALIARGGSRAVATRTVSRVPETRADGPPVRAAPPRTAPKAAAARSQPVETLGRDGSAASRVRRLHEAGALTDAAVALALDKREIAFVVEALALRAALPAETVRRMIKVQSARTMVALSWKGGFGARFAMDIQRHLAAIPPPRIINARDGIDYALTPAEMQEQLALFD